MKLWAILVLAAFYSIYLGKMVRQRQQGIQTDHMGKGQKDRTVVRSEAVMKAATYGIVVIQLVSILADWSMLTGGLWWLRWLGLLLGAAGVAVFAAAIVTMRESWRAGIPEKQETRMITEGIYRYSRNPAFLGFYLMYAGILLLYFNWLLLGGTILAVCMLHHQILQEELYLAGVFGDAYLDYKRHVRRYI